MSEFGDQGDYAREFDQWASVAVGENFPILQVADASFDGRMDRTELLM